MASNAPPLKAPFFEASIEKDGAGMVLRFLRTSKEWSQWVANVATAVAFAPFWAARTESADYTVQKADSVILVNGDVTITLPPEFPGWQKRITVKKINAGGGTTTVAADGFLIDGAATWSTTTQYESADIVGDGTNGFLV